MWPFDSLPLESWSFTWSWWWLAFLLIPDTTFQDWLPGEKRHTDRPLCSQKTALKKSNGEVWPQRPGSLSYWMPHPVSTGAWMLCSSLSYLVNISATPVSGGLIGKAQCGKLLGPKEELPRPPGQIQGVPWSQTPIGKGIHVQALWLKDHIFKNPDLGMLILALESWEMEYFLPYQSTRMSQSLATVATTNGKAVNPEETQERKNACYLAAIRLQPLPTVSPGKTQDVKNARNQPQIAEVHVKGMILLSPDSRIFPNIEKLLLFSC